MQARAFAAIAAPLARDIKYRHISAMTIVRYLHISKMTFVTIEHII